MSSWVKREGWLRGHIPEKKRVILKTESQEENKTEQEPIPPIQYGVIYHPLRCPKCKSKNIKTHTSEPPIRYHKCRDCGYNFRSREAEG